MRRTATLIFMISLLALAALACGVGGDNGGAAATRDALGQSVVLTATAQAAVTPTVRVDTAATVAAAEAAATAAAQTVQESVEVEATTEAVEAAATEDAQAYIKEELVQYGIDPNQGRLGFIHEDTQIYVEGYMGFDYANQNAGTVAADFVMAADITWNTQYGTTGCGFVVRSDGDQDENFNQYAIIATRGASGHVLFFTQQEGDINLDLSYDIYANGIDPLFEWQNDTTNRLVVIGRGDNFEIWTNGTLIGEITAQAGFDRGFVVLVALNESGYTDCRFSNTWLWLLN